MGITLGCAVAVGLCMAATCIESRTYKWVAIGNCTGHTRTLTKGKMVAVPTVTVRTELAAASWECTFSLERLTGTALVHHPNSWGVYVPCRVTVSVLGHSRCMWGVYPCKHGQGWLEGSHVHVHPQAARIYSQMLFLAQVLSLSENACQLWRGVTHLTCQYTKCLWVTLESSYVHIHP